MHKVRRSTQYLRPCHGDLRENAYLYCTVSDIIINADCDYINSSV